MSRRFITLVIIGVAFAFTQLWFAYWVVKLLKEKQRVLKARRDAAAARKPDLPAAAGESPGQSDAGSGI
jgi:hypothetical protein